LLDDKRRALAQEEAAQGTHRHTLLLQGVDDQEMVLVPIAPLSTKRTGEKPTKGSCRHFDQKKISLRTKKHHIFW
jgi:hypothetical protein